MRCCRARLAEFRQQDAEWRFPGARLEGMKLRINRPSRWVYTRQVRGFGVAAPIRWADHTGARSPSRAADAHRLRL